MRFVRHSLIGLLFVTVTISAHAQASRTWVSGVGDDVNPCSRTAPCKTFAGAISKTAANGEIDALDPGGFGSVTITKGITIDGCCITSILASGTQGILINTNSGATGDLQKVIIRHLTINGSGGSNGAGGGGTYGIRVLQAKNVSVENCYIFGFTG